MNVPHKFYVLLHKLDEGGHGPIRLQGGEFRCQCPAHDDRGPSFYASFSEDKILLSCNAGCTGEQICDRLDHDLADLFFDADEPWVEHDAGRDPSAGYVTQEEKSSLTPDEPAANPAAVRGEIYNKLLASLELSEAHFEDLRRRGLTGEEITRLGYRTADAARCRLAVDALLENHGRDKLLAVPGFQDRQGRIVFQATTGMLIPVRDGTGAVVAIKVRHDAVAGGPKYTWASSPSASCGSPVHVPLGVTVPCQTVRLTEGELKADIAFSKDGLPTVSAPGVNNWQLAVPVLKGMGGKTVHLAMDQDGKPGTLAAIDKALYGLHREGFEVALEWWDGQIAKGVDDLLAAGHRPELVGGLDAAGRVRDALSPGKGQVEEADREPEPPPFPLEVFPPAMATYCREVADSTGTPPDFASLTMLVTAGAAIGNSRAICLKPNAWYESPRIYAANVGDPASGKTPAMETVVKPYHAQQQKLVSEYAAAQRAYAAAEEAFDRISKKNRSLPEEDRSPLPSVPPEPGKLERFVAGNATVESLSPMLEDNPRGLLMSQDEGVGWVRGMGQYKGGKGNDRQFWLSTWSGQSYLVDRKTQDGVPISIPRPFINVVCGLPPDMLNELADHQGRNDGFLHRVLFAFPRSSAGADWTDATVSGDSILAWKMAISRLRQLEMQEHDDGVPGYQVVEMTEEAKQVWVAWYDSHAAEMRDPALPAQLIGPWGKLKAYTARLALIVHFLWAEGGETDLGPESIERAARLIGYFKEHLRIVYGRLRQTPEDNQLLDVIQWIRQQGGRCTARDLVRARKVTPTREAKKMLAELQDRGYGRLEGVVAENNRKVQWFTIDPS